MKNSISIDDYILFAKCSPISIILLDSNYNIININTAVEETLGLKLGSIKNKTITEFAPFSNEKVKDNLENLKLNGINSFFGPMEVQFNVESETKWLRFTMSPIRANLCRRHFLQ